MISFVSDYIEGAHPLILENLAKTNMEALPGYGSDVYCDRAKAKIREACKLPDADVFLLVGGTQTNQTVISALLASYEGVVSAVSGHVNAHEAGAIEHAGHKVLALPSHLGKLDASEVRDYLNVFFADANHDHMVFPGMVYISYPTEYGTLYTKKELEALYAVCKDFKIPLYIDGARLAYGLMSRQADVTLPELARLCDVFYIGGTKVGALIGEAVVFSGMKAPAHFMTIVKQHGALLAKGRVLGIQFDTLFTDDLYFKLGKNAIDTAEQLKQLFIEKGYTFFIDSPTNQQFVILENSRMEELSGQVSFDFWEKYDDSHTVVRFATSWATTAEKVEKLRELL